MRRAVAAGLLLGALAGCHSGSTSAPTPVPTVAASGRFDDQDQARIACMRHQAAPPGTEYTGGAGTDTGRILLMLRYYVAHGRRPYCDRRPATAVDRAWATLYVRLGANPAAVAPILRRTTPPAR